MNDLDKIFEALANQLIDAAQQAGTDIAGRTRTPFDDWLVAGVNRFINAHQSDYVAFLTAKLKELLEKIFAGQAGQAGLAELKTMLKMQP